MSVTYDASMTSSPHSPGSPLSSPELADAYADLRGRCIAIGRSLTEEQAAEPTACCPAWSVKDTLAHLAGITTDILSGNTKDAATEAWADGHVATRVDNSLEEVCVEWETNAQPIDDVLRAMGDQIMPQFYLDAWTHEWDIRQATGIGAKPDMRFVDHTWDALMDIIIEQNGGPLEAEVDRFELMRISMGRRSRSQVEAIGLRPDGVVYWSPNHADIIDAPRE